MDAAFNPVAEGANAGPLAPSADMLTPAALAPPADTLTPVAALELWQAAEAGACGLRVDEFAAVLASVGAKLNHNLPAGKSASAAERGSFFAALKLPDLALAHGCALGRELAWERFMERYRAPLTQAACAIARSATLGEELAGSLYAELYGLRQGSGEERRSPLAGYTGRGSLMGWLRSTLAQRHVDHHRRTHRETSLDEALESGVAPPPDTPAEPPMLTKLLRLRVALGRTLRALSAEDRFLLSASFLDRRTLAEVGRTLHVHEATISRRLKRLTGDLREHLLKHLQAGGLSRRAAEETLGTDPRDLELNLRRLLQTSETSAFQAGEGRQPAPTPERQNRTDPAS